MKMNLTKMILIKNILKPKVWCSNNYTTQLVKYFNSIPYVLRYTKSIWYKIENMFYFNQPKVYILGLICKLTSDLNTYILKINV